jgi:hypothetical protein
MACTRGDVSQKKFLFKNSVSLAWLASSTSMYQDLGRPSARHHSSDDRGSLICPSDRTVIARPKCAGKRLKVMIPILLPALEQHGRLRFGQADRDRVLSVSAATIDRLLGDVKVAANADVPESIRRSDARFRSARQ